MARQSLVERTAEKNVEDNDVSEKEKLVSELRTSEGVVEFCSITGEWDELGDARKFANQSVDEITDDANLVIPEDLYDSLQEFGMACSSCWDDEGEVFRIKCKEDAEGDLKSLVVPIGSSISEDFTVQEIHNDDGEFVAGHVEEQVDFEMYELWSKDMYIRDLSEDADVLAELDRNYANHFSESVREMEGDLLNQSSASEWLTKTIILSIIVALSGIVSYFLYSLSALFVISRVALVMPVLTLFALTSPVLLYQLSIGISSAKKSIDRNRGKQYEKLFATR